MRRKLLFPFIAVLLLTPWPTIYLYTNYTEASGVRIEAVAGNATGWKAYGNAIGGVSAPFDIFYLNAATLRSDMLVTVYLTNTFDLSHFYRYLILKIGVYIRDDTDGWQKAVSSAGEILPDTYLTMQNANVRFNLKGRAQYKLTIESGSFYCYPNSKAVSPALYLTAQ